MLQLILGGARSGKSRLAEKLASDSALPVIYIATSQPLDGEMNQRVALHRQRRPDHWGLIEEPIELARVLRENATPERCLLVDCLTLWLTNLLLLDNPSAWFLSVTNCSKAWPHCQVKSCLSATRPVWVSCRWAN